MSATTAKSDDQELNREAAEFADDVKRGARRVRSAVHDGADAVASAVKPSFGEQLGDAARSLGTDPSSTPGLVRDLVRDHPFAALATATLTAALIGRVLFAMRR